MTADLTLSQLDELERCLEDLCAQAGADLALLADETGQTVASSGDTRRSDLAILAALAAANLAATVAIAGQVGERGSCHGILYEGDCKRIYIVAGPGELVLLVVTANEVPIGAVRYFLQQARPDLEAVLLSAEAAADVLLGADLDLEAGFAELFGVGLDMEAAPDEPA